MQRQTRSDSVYDQQSRIVYTTDQNQPTRMKQEAKLMRKVANHPISCKKMSRHGCSLLLVFGSLLWLVACKIQPSETLFNCFTPNMFKMGGKLGQLAPHPGERANWYPQSQQPYAVAMMYGQHPMSRLFQPKWRASLFGPKRWMDWRMGANMNFYRPGYGYLPASAQVPPPPLASLNPASNANNYNQYSEQLNLSPFANNPSAQQLPDSATYGPQGQQLGINNYVNDGWSVPYLQPSSRPGYQQPYTDSYSVMPGNPSQPARQQYDPNSYGTKGASGNKQQQSQQYTNNQQQYGTTKKILVADGGYNSIDAHLMSHHQPARNYSRTGFGYSYPEWYTGVVESPAKIAQQLYKIQQRRAMLGLY